MVSCDSLTLVSHEWGLCYNLNVVLLLLSLSNFFLLFPLSVAVSVVSFISLASAQEIQECFKAYITLDDSYLTDIDRNYRDVCNIFSMFF